jgi:hypothetical protein
MSINNTVSFTNSELPVPKSMANRNKKKGFLREMTSVQGTKTVFGDDTQASSTPIKNMRRIQATEDRSIVTVDSSITTSKGDAAYSTPNRQPVSSRVVPPSEMDLPSNVFVTHQVYDRHGWAPRGRRGRGQQDESVVMGDEATGEQVEEGHPVDVPGISTGALVDSTLAVNGEEEQAVVDDAGVWEEAESGFDTLAPVTGLHLLRKGIKLAWKVCVFFASVSYR